MYSRCASRPHALRHTACQTSQDVKNQDAWFIYEHRRVISSLFYIALSLCKWLCNAWKMRPQTYVYLPSCNSPPPTSLRLFFEQLDSSAGDRKVNKQNKYNKIQRNVGNIMKRSSHHYRHRLQIPVHLGMSKGATSSVIKP